MASWNGKDADANARKLPQPNRNPHDKRMQGTLGRRYWLTEKGARFLAELDRQHAQEKQTGGAGR